MIPADKLQVLLQHCFLDFEFTLGRPVPVEASVQEGESVCDVQVVSIKVPGAAEIAAHLAGRQMTVEVDKEGR